MNDKIYTASMIAFVVVIAWMLGPIAIWVFAAWNEMWVAALEFGGWI